ncbi:YaaA family protein [Desulfobulbus rhabdoformis]|uniref:YaaA family protein n=1 Tax=Desulfobulbus rhabdoformis TaxID=34032 RepID=UPI0019647683|nr:YaaA family protein [Desulfobulbus rhabdoformis]MBM9613623.1 YaaA family protein [Desulfobulbus rhabdoformis]
MILFTSSKGQNFSPTALDFTPTEPVFQEKALYLNQLLTSLSPAKLQLLMGISDTLCEETLPKIASFPTAKRKPALISYSGEAYKSLEPDSLPSDAREFGQAHLRILSGMYGLLRPYDLIAPHRLEMGYKLASEAGPTLYPFWKDAVTQHLNATMRQNRSEALFNLASVEYSKVVDKKNLICPFVDIQFKEDDGGRLKSVAVYAKRARGLMVRYLLSNQITAPEALLQFRAGGYSYRPELSKEHLLVFTRPKP